MKSVCSALGVARSNLHVLHHRPGDWPDARRGRVPGQDESLLADIRRHIAELPSYGYRRAGALLNRERRSQGQGPLNHKRIYRIMARHQLLLPKAPKREHSSRVHDGQVSVPTSNMRWCSDGFEIKCYSGETVTATFAKDCCDREILAWRAWQGKGLPGEPVRDMLVEAVERRFGTVEAIPQACELEFLTDNVLNASGFLLNGNNRRNRSGKASSVKPKEQRTEPAMRIRCVRLPWLTIVETRFTTTLPR